MPKRIMRINHATFVSGVIYENRAIDKSMEIRKLVPSKEKRIAPDGNS